MVLLFLACTGPTPPDHAMAVPEPGVKTHGNLPILTESELKAENKARQDCLDACQGDAACQGACNEKYPIRQVEVIPDPPVLSP